MTYQKYFHTEESEALLTQTSRDQHDVVDLVDENTAVGRWFNRFIMGLILANVALFFAATTEPFYSRHALLLEVFEALSVLIFAAEYGLRLYAAPLKHDTVTPAAARVAYVTSFFGLVDLTGFLPYFLTVFVSRDHLSLAVVRVLRILRVFRAEGQYFEAFTLFDDVFRANASMLKVTGFTGLGVWLFVSTFNYLAERQNKAVEGAYGTFFGSMWWSLVNLNGEFPINDDLTAWGKVVACGTVVAAVGVFAIPTGVLGAGLRDLYSERRQEAAAEEAAAGPSEPKVEVCNRCMERQLETAPFIDRLWWHMEGKSRLGRAIDYFMLVLILLNVLVFALSTVPKFYFAGPLQWFEAISVLIFTAEFALNVYSCAADPRFAGRHGRLRYVASFYGLVDLCAIIPWWVDLIYPGDIVPTAFLRVLRLLKLLRTDIETFALFGEVYHLQRDMIWTGAFIGLVLWVCFASVMHFTERFNPDDEVRAEFQTGAGSAWIVLLNLTGEYPIANYTLLGRLLSFVSSVCAIGVFAIPTGLFADGFEEVLSKRSEEAEKRAKDPPICALCHNNADEMNGAPAVIGMDEAVNRVVKEQEEEAVVLMHEPEDAREKVFLFLNGVTEEGQRFEWATIGLILLNIFCLAISSEASIMKAHRWLHVLFHVLEWVTMLLFTAEYAGRIWSAPENPKFRRGNPYLREATSFYTVIDLLAILPFWVDELLPSITIMPTTIFRIFRLMKLLKGEKYAPALTLLDDVFAAKRTILACTGIMAGVLVVVFATLLHYSEKDNPTKVEELTIGQRYVDVPHALFYTTLHLTGDYPLYQYTGWGRVVCFVMIVVATGLVGIPTGAIAGGFQTIIEATRKARTKEKDHVDKLVIRLGYFDKFCRPCRVKVATQKGLPAQVYTFLHGDTRAGACFVRLLVVTIAVDLFAFALQTDRFFVDDTGDWPFTIIDVFSAVLFTVEYALRVYASAEDPDYPSRLDYAMSFLALVDLAAIVPFYISLAVGKTEGWSTVLRCLRMVRLLKMEHYLEAFTLFDNVMARAHGVLVTTSVAAFVIWVGAATLFWVLESGNPLVNGKFDSIPLSLFYTILFLGGEWAVCDFTVGGQLLGVAMCVAGIGLFAVPTGVLYGGFEEMLALRRQTRAKQRQGAMCEGCGQRIRHFLHHRTQDEP